MTKENTVKAIFEKAELDMSRPVNKRRFKNILSRSKAQIERYAVTAVTKEQARFIAQTGDNNRVRRMV